MVNVLEVKGLTVQFSKKSGKVTVVDQVDMFIRKGESLGIVGESGCGKSVTSLAIMRLLDSHGTVHGSVLLNGEEVLSISKNAMRDIRGKEIAMIFQEPMTSLNPVLTIGRQLSEVLEEHQGKSKARNRERVIELLKQVGISRPEEIYREYAHRLSGGMRQRVMIAMAIACNPTLLIADEPTTALDVTIQAQILELIQKIRSDFGMSMILITHDLGVMAEVCDRVMVMYAGQVIESADVRTLLRYPKHPYTVGLIRSAPHRSKEQSRLHSISGSVPSPEEMPSGCRFAPRCEKVMPVCWEKNPILQQVDQQSACRCWLYEGNGEGTVVNG